MIVDCGECAQLSFRRQRLKFSRITDIFISHLHGDHVLGLPGLLATLALNDVEGTIRVHIFKEGAEMIKHTLRLVAHELTFDLIFNILDPDGGQTLIDDHALTVSTFKLNHSTPCVGFRWDEKPKPRHIIGDMVRFYDVPHYMMNSIRQGADFVTPSGEVIANNRLTTDPTPSVSYAYCSDTIYDPSVVDAVRGVTTLYHESTYDATQEAKALMRGHSTSVQAARVALEAGVNQLLLGHFSNKYPDEDLLVEQARAIFPNTIAATEGMKISLL